MLSRSEVTNTNHAAHSPTKGAESNQREYLKVKVYIFASLIKSKNILWWLAPFLSCTHCHGSVEFFFNFPPELASLNDGLHGDWFSRWVRAETHPSGQWSPGDRGPSVVTRDRGHLLCPVSRSQPKCVNVKEFPRSQNILYVPSTLQLLTKVSWKEDFISYWGAS